MHKQIPTNLIFGFLGSGKTTTIQSLLERKPASEHWAVLVNEFGEVGIDGQLLDQKGATIREVPGGCMCCVAGLPMQMGLNMLIKASSPDRLLIEPTGLGHPHQILETLTSTFYQDVLDIRTCVTIIDPAKLDNPKVLANENFRAQTDIADVLIGNKTDHCDEPTLAGFERWAHSQQPPKRRVHQTTQGRFPPEWLDERHADLSITPPVGHATHDAPPRRQWEDLDSVPWQQALNQGEGHFSCGWRIHPDTQLDFAGLHALAHEPQWRRFKGVLNTTEGWRAINAAGETITTSEVPEQSESRLEIITDHLINGQQLDARLKRLSQ
ncbi:G3E family GTPase [Tamilnaduibacter salinus]|uniref:G3E family GTPase n=1 Tax=Tamilnaduibacter salinus TaxID=1484056 RepID=A0A2U1CXZ7_9GAMM|nr:GTP-binding protein [Tamilnaduibacter salinus]PVY77356.1 G3E family GTPase [Tamilnaduibacter salinus]